MQHQSIQGGGTVILIMLAGFVLTCPVAALDAPASDPAMIEQMTYDLCTFERAFGSEERVAAATYIAMAMEERGLSVGTGRFAYASCYFDPQLSLSSSIIGVREGATDEIVVICAHYDTTSPEMPGADDNAAGVATMLEVARILEDLPLNRSVYFIAFGGEETGLDGSRRWLADNPDLHDRIVLAINLDCVASGDRLQVTALPQHRWILGTFPPSACLEETTMPPLNLARGDDHTFRAAMIPVVQIYEEDSRQIMHTPDDRPERLNYTLAAECARIVAGSVAGTDAAAGDPAPEIDLRIEDGTIVFTGPGDAPVEVIVDGTSLGLLPSGSVTLPEGPPHTVQAITYGPGGTRAVATATGEGVGTEPPAMPGTAIAIPWVDGPRDIVRFTFPAIPLSYHLERPEEGARVDGYLDGVLIRNLDNDHAVVPGPGLHTFTVVASRTGEGVIGTDQTAFTLERFSSVDLDGGLLQVDETGGVACSASARTYTYNYNPGERYHIVVGCTYTDTTDALLQKAAFRVDGPDGRDTGYRFYDIPVLDDSQTREIMFWLEPEGPGTFRWNISCSKGDGNAVGTGSLILC
ncbi:Zn-dependent exopeptidase M28 [Methanofollis formosanus]|uniref:Zn-dependent exopeptidase M28 n=1 Tax=Methanofollis formosanus TaxID=299308 RepID=A0A8G1A3R5_9EURY|nr:M28 family metallopeptidase [Methanofollis formosanus]QYZ80050.1 Zn-dependent exopeptidase M28 [Methanofollis formosanus]